MQAFVVYESWGAFSTAQAEGGFIGLDGEHAAGFAMGRGPKDSRANPLSVLVCRWVA